MREVTALPQLPPRAADSHKGSFGHVLAVVGSRGMSGAAVLCGTAILRSGAGLATVACPEAIQDIVAAGFPCYTTHGLSSNEAGQLTVASSSTLRATAEACDLLAIGPGLGRGDSVALVVRNLLKTVAKPIVLDADGLFAIAPLNDDILTSRSHPTVLTPHPGEFARLTGEAAPSTHEARLAAATGFAKQHKIVLLLKGHRTIVTDGENYFVNSTGNPGMATGGCGDVLTGIIAALIGQHLSPFDAAALGAHLHGKAGDLAAEVLGQVSMCASDLLTYLPAAFRF